jgi:cytochrome c oxidase subunit 2
LVLVTVPFLAIFIALILKAARRGGAGGRSLKAYALAEAIWLVSVTALWLFINSASLAWIPTTTVPSGEVQELEVEAFMWAFNLTTTELHAGVPVKITARSLDTVHSFAIYSPDGELLFTLMLMPGGGGEELVYIFEKPGRYLIRCLEYCGDGHAFMMAYLTVS